MLLLDVQYITYTLIIPCSSKCVNVLRVAVSAKGKTFFFYVVDQMGPDDVAAVWGGAAVAGNG